MHHANDTDPEAEAARLEAGTLATNLLMGLQAMGASEALAVNAMACAIVMVAQHSESVNWREVVVMLKGAATGLELAMGETAGGMH